MKSLAIVLSLIISLASFGQSEEVLRLSGKFVIKKGVEGQDNDLYFRIKDKRGKSYAYPVRVLNSKLRDSIRKNTKKTYTIEAVAKQKNIKINEVSKFVHFLDIQSASTFELSSLGVSSQDNVEREPDIPYYDRENPSKSKGGYRVSDKAANSIIFAAGAALLGAIIAQ
ncbi:hypothetical protein BIY24_13535 [Halobacteriovorax marinus]|uniref:hypothetical protein n=1 Tax=Halobacteriovorax marinus TaxID=97084 RepID=UPI000BC36304|nr:hypothetical protein [Halobacteriovorax marinus]ATH08931.1 hypothetical protein BIY24_13535 [Halobacteriovorax marinus]